MIKRKRILSAIIAICLAATVLSGCGLFTEQISFSSPSLSLIYGQTEDLNDYITIKNAKSGVYTLTSDDTDIVEVVAGSTIKAMGEGATSVTATLASGNFATITINVDFAKAGRLTLHESGELYQDLSDTTAVSFTAVLNDGANPATPVKWTVNGSPKSGESNQMTLPAATEKGTYTVKAEIKDSPQYFDEVSVRVYQDFELPTVIYNGATTFGNLEPVSFDFSALSEDNPEYLFEMLVDGEVAESIHSFNPSIGFTPTAAGQHTFSFRVNGQDIEFADGSTSITITYTGIIQPVGLRLSFDGSYPLIRIEWDNREEVLFTIEIELIGVGVALSVIGYSAHQGYYEFSGSIFDISKNYKIRVKSQDTGDVFLGSDFVEIEHKAISIAAIAYLEKNSVGGNFYMTSDEEVLAIFDYMLIFRPNALKSGSSWISTCSVFMGYTSQKTTSEFSTLFKNRLIITGKYSWTVTGKTALNQIMTINVTYLSADEPTDFDTSTKTPLEILVAPVTSQQGRVGDLPVDNREVSPEKISTTNELFYTLEKGFFPDCTENSAAQLTFDKARDILMSITAEDMGQAELARAIYDWIMFTVTYDTAATEIKEINSAVLQPAYYPEGVFVTGFAVCDGIAKTYSIMCNMVGLRCIRVLGKAGKTDHAWNKVVVDRGWYIVDATWGGSKVTMSGDKLFKSGTHEYFLMSDADVAGSHAQISLDYPVTPATNYGWFAKNGQYIYDNVDLATQCEAIASFVVANRREKSYTVAGQPYTGTYRAFEFKFAPSLAAEFASSTNILTNRIVAKGIGFEYLCIGSTIIICCK